MVPLHPQTGRRAKRKAQRGSNREALQVGLRSRGLGGHVFHVIFVEGTWMFQEVRMKGWISGL